jgi:hypothetical protein
MKPAQTLAMSGKRQVFTIKQLLVIIGLRKPSGGNQ